MRTRGRAAEWTLVGAITLGAAVLRLLYISRVSPDPFYDAAVRSMTLSWHNFFFGVFEPGGSVSIDKPPIDLWLQVISVKLFGFSSTTLKLPEVAAGIASVPLLYAAVRRMWSPAAGIAAAIAIAVLPVEVITSRSDTMDAVMMVLIVLALLLIVRSFEDGRKRWLLSGAAVLGLAFDVKLLESLVALPGIAALAYFGLPGRIVSRLGKLALAGVVFLVVALSWLTATLIAPANDRPWAIGSSNGSAWNAAFVFNGTERLGGKSPEPQGTVYEAGHVYPTATQSQRDHIPIVPPSPTRLLARVGPLSGERLGMEVLIALLLGIPALLWGLTAGRAMPAARAAADGERDAPGGPPADAGEREPGAAPPPHRQAPEKVGAGSAGDPAATPVAGERPAATRGPRAALGAAAALELRMRRASAAGLGLWMLTGLVLFSGMTRLHPRYVEGFSPAVAAMLGIGVAWVAVAVGRLRLLALLVALGAAVYYGERLLYGRPGEWWISLLGALGALGCALIARAAGAPATLRSTLLPAGVIALTLLAVLAIPLSADVTAIETHVTDAGYVGALPSAEQQPLSAYLRANQRGARYEVAAESATQIGSLIVQDARPILVLTTYNGRVYTTVAQLRSAVAKGEVRYAFLNTFCGKHSASVNPACSAPAKWVRAHGIDVSRRAGLSQHRTLYLLPGASP